MPMVYRAGASCGGWESLVYIPQDTHTEGTVSHIPVRLKSPFPGITSPLQLKHTFGVTPSSGGQHGVMSSSAWLWPYSGMVSVQSRLDFFLFCFCFFELEEGS